MRYTNIGDEVTVPGTLVQATIALDVAGKFAQETKNQDMMIRVAEGWMRLAGLMADLEESEESKKPSEKTNKVKMGFQPGEKDDENARSDEDGADEGSSGDGVHPESRQF